LGAIDPLTFSNLTNLLYVNLTANQIVTLDPSTFANNLAMTVVYLGRNLIASLPATIFQKNPNIYYIDLSFNALTYLNKTLFSNNTLLQHIYLNDNKLDAIYKSTFSNLTLSTLLLRNNVCINLDFEWPAANNGTAIMIALTKCDANANCPANTLIGPMKSMVGFLQTLQAMMVNMTAVFNAIKAM
jgi:Leucine-rich repeat (LRR) protein